MLQIPGYVCCDTLFSNWLQVLNCSRLFLWMVSVSLSCAWALLNRCWYFLCAATLLWCRLLWECASHSFLLMQVTLHMSHFLCTTSLLRLALGSIKCLGIDGTVPANTVSKRIIRWSTKLRQWSQQKMKEKIATHRKQLHMHMVSLRILKL